MHLKLEAEGASFFFLALQPGMWDLSSLTKDQTLGPLQRKPRVLTIGLPGNTPEGASYKDIMQLAKLHWGSLS